MGAKSEKDADITCDISQKLYELLTSPGTEVTNIIFPDNEVVCVSWKHSEGNITAGKNVNVAVSAYVITQTGQKLY